MAAMLQTLRNDVRYAVRLLRRSPGFAGATILTLALSIGANAAIYSAVQGVLISRLPYPDPERLVRLFEEAPETPHFPMSPADFRDYRAELQTFEGLAAYLRADLQLGDAARPEHLRGMQVSAGFFRLAPSPYGPLYARNRKNGRSLCRSMNRTPRSVQKSVRYVGSVRTLPSSMIWAS